MPIEVLGFYRLALATLVLSAWVLFKNNSKPLCFKKNVHYLWVITSGCFFFLHLWTYIYAAKNTSIANTVIIFSTTPIWASIGSVLFFKDKISPRVFLAYVLSFIGVYILVASGGSNFKSINSGDASAFITALFWAGYMLTGKKARLYFDNTTYAIGQYATTAVLFFTCTLYTGSQLTGYDNISWYSVIGLVLLPTLLGHYSFTYLVQYMNLSLMTCGKLIEPAIASLMAYFIFNETLNSNAWISFVLTSFSVLILFSPNIKLALQKNN